ncbi:E3 ubiquitin-protein ligase TRIM56-like [Heterodontus francisci]|uniref:E3 ubiquitin-protein ligase TRIM56-like n=1 Tax=Heterodontus francisci TaxID=7792 RepID=UPI00355B6EE8
MATSSTIADKIQNDFLNCKICLNTFKHPKMLPCLHTYCQGCLENVISFDRKIRCPECREVVDLRDGVSKLKTNFHINSLLDIFQSPEKKEVMCSLCPPEWKSKNCAVVRCLGCTNYMCQSCGDGHRSAHPTHKIVDVSSSSPGESDAEMMMKQKICCQIHPKDPVSTYCKTCGRVICFKCSSRSCTKHKLLAMHAAAESMKPAAKKLIERLRTDIQSLAQQEDDLNEAMVRVKVTEHSVMSSIENTLTEVLNYLFKQGDAIKKTVSDYVKEQEELYKSAQSNLQLQKKKAQDTREFCERVITAGKAKEIVCIQSIIEDQINALQALSSLDVNKASPKLIVNKSIKDIISQTNLFSITFGEEPVPESQPTPTNTGKLKYPSETLQANAPIAQPKQRANYLYSFDTEIPSDEFEAKLTGVSISRNGDIIVVDEENSVLKCYQDGGILDKMITLPDEDEDPCSVAVCDDIIACSAKNRLYLLEMDGALVKKLFLRGSESVYPIAAFKDEYVAVSEGTLCSISLYNTDGHVVDRVKPLGYEGIRFLFIAINSDEEFIVSDCGKKCIIIFNRSGEIITVCNESYVNGVQSALNPFSVSVDRNDNIYVTEPSRILLFSPIGMFEEQLLSTADGLHRPRVITIDQNDNLIVTQGNGCVCVYYLTLD